jgi:hypothetical protein
MLPPYISALVLTLPLIWNILTVLYLLQRARKGILSPLRFSLMLTLGLSITVSTMLMIVLGVAYGISSRNVGFALLVFSIHIFFGFPVAYFTAKFLMRKYFSNWSSNLKNANGT